MHSSVDTLKVVATMSLCTKTPKNYLISSLDLFILLACFLPNYDFILFLQNDALYF